MKSLKSVLELWTVQGQQPIDYIVNLSVFAVFENLTLLWLLYIRKSFCYIAMDQRLYPF